jgi:hypothetical protein
VVPGAGSLTISPSDVVATTAWREKGAAKNPQDLNRYSYAENNPILKNDPTGHCSGGSAWNNFVSVFNGTCMRKGMVIAARGRTAEEKALGVLAYAGPPVAVALATLGTYGLAAPAIGVLGTSAVTTGAELSAYQIAREGGKHAGFLKNYENLAIGKIEKGIRSLDGRVQEHLAKIANPAQYAKDWGSMSAERQAKLLHFWEKEIANYSEQAAVLRGLVDGKMKGQP